VFLKYKSYIVFQVKEKIAIDRLQIFKIQGEYFFECTCKVKISIMQCQLSREGTT